jgi:4'-phosphopantetheinyl transferase
MLINSLRRETHVWYSIPESVRDPALLQRLKCTLSDAELDKYQRLRFPEDRHRYLVSHALVRETLSKYVDMPPAAWHFSHGEHGRPEIDVPDTPPLRFNMSHTEGLVCCTVTLDDDCGIDAEKITARHAASEIAKRMFSADENADLETLSGDAQLEYFYTCWTLREAYGKARGLGITFPMRKLTFSFMRTQSVQVTFDPDVKDNAALWDFQLFRPTAAHILATASRSENHPVKRVRLKEFAFQPALVITTDTTA